MVKENIPIPICGTCRESGEKNYTTGDTTYRCLNCGTEMRYLPAGELLTSKSSNVKKNNGWITTFSMTSSELYSGRVMVGIGVMILILSLSFLWLGKIDSEVLLWSGGSGMLLIILGRRKSTRQKKKVAEAMGRYPYWNK